MFVYSTAELGRERGLYRGLYSARAGGVVAEHIGSKHGKDLFQLTLCLVSLFIAAGLVCLSCLSEGVSRIAVDF